MGLWIRSQDRKILRKVNNIEFTECYRNKKTKQFYNDIYSELEKFDKFYVINDLGIYASEEKALKVLDMIQKHIEDQNSYFGEVMAGSKLGGTILTQSIKIFKMPIDEEVEK